LARLALLQLNPTSAARIQDALSTSHELILFSEWAQLAHALESEGWDGCLIDPFALTPAIPTSELKRMRVRHPDLLIVVFADFTGRGAQMTMLGRILDEIIVAGVEDDIESIRRVVSNALGHALARRLRSALTAELVGIEAEALVWSARNAGTRPRVAHLARSLNESSRSLSDRLRSEGACTARSLLLWGRLFRAGQMLGRGRNTVQSVAFALGYSADSAFRKTVRAHLGVPPSRVPENGGFDLVIHKFLETRRTSRIMRLTRAERSTRAGVS
jgi:AraC-like DNA-binding protein